MAAAAAYKSIYEKLLTTGSTHGTEVPMLPFKDMNMLVGFEQVWAFEKRYPEPE